jgi:hypothetical protein
MKKPMNIPTRDDDDGQDPVGGISDPKDLWYGRGSMALILNMSVSQFDNVIVPQLDGRHIRKDGRRKLYFAPPAVQLSLAMHEAKHQSRHGHRRLPPGAVCRHCGEVN